MGSFFRGRARCAERCAREFSISLSLRRFATLDERRRRLPHQDYLCANVPSRLCTAYPNVRRVCEESRMWRTSGGLVVCLEGWANAVAGMDGDGGARMYRWKGHLLGDRIALGRGSGFG